MLEMIINASCKCSKSSPAATVFCFQYKLIGSLINTGNSINKWNNLFLIKSLLYKKAFANTVWMFFLFKNKKNVSVEKNNLCVETSLLC